MAEPTDIAAPMAQRVPLEALQHQFASALMRPDDTPPASVAGGSETERIRRFNIYRNNVHASLAGALAARFPVIRRLVGDDFFRAMALVFIRSRLPGSPVLWEYGARFPAFLDAFEPAAGLPYLPDVARIEWLRNIAYHAADAEPVAIGALSGLPAGSLEDARLALHPAACWVASDYPVFSIWQTNAHDETVRPIGPELAGETALITRPGLHVLVTLLPPGSAMFLRAVRDGEGLGPALTHASSHAPEFDLPATLSALFASGAVAGVNAPGIDLKGGV